MIAVAVLGTDAVFAGLPASPVQLAHACMRAGYDLVVPASWGDELIASECLRDLAQRGPRPVVMCSCPYVRRELLAVGGDLAPMLVSLVAPPVAVARYLHALFGRDRVRVTYIGACPGAAHPDIDIHLGSADLLSTLRERGIVPAEQPKVFDSVIPPDRRRYFSVAGGVPSSDHLWSGANARTLVELETDDVLIELAQRLLARESALIDLAPRLGCACTGAASGAAPHRARAMVAAMEPPRAASAVVDVGLALDLAAPMDLGAPARPAPVEAARAAAKSRPVPERSRQQGVGGKSRVGHEGRRRSPASGVKAMQTVIPIARVAGRSLPRAYVARRRSAVAAAATLPADPTPAPASIAVDQPEATLQVNGKEKKRSRAGSGRAQNPGAAHRPVVAAPAGIDAIGDPPRE